MTEANGNGGREKEHSDFHHHRQYDDEPFHWQVVEVARESNE
tara:strand:- start:916 stop:1041 length:126 start_codon:yes stop_codon:yes gene_type:complete